MATAPHFHSSAAHVSVAAAATTFGVATAARSLAIRDAVLFTGSEVRVLAKLHVAACECPAFIGRHARTAAARASQHEQRCSAHLRVPDDEVRRANAREITDHLSLMAGETGIHCLETTTTFKLAEADSDD